MMTYEFWLEQILGLAKDIGDRAGQEEQWLSTPEENAAAAKAGRLCIWDPDELYCLLDDFSFEVFWRSMQKPSRKLNEVPATLSRCTQWV